MKLFRVSIRLISVIKKIKYYLVWRLYYEKKKSYCSFDDDRGFGCWMRCQADTTTAAPTQAETTQAETTQSETIQSESQKTEEKTESVTGKIEEIKDFMFTIESDKVSMQ